MIEGFVSIKTIISRLYRKLDYNTEINELDLVEWCSDALLLIGSYAQYKPISECLKLNNGIAKLPCGFYKLIDISYQNLPLMWASNSVANNYQCEGCQIPKCCVDYTFYINDGCIITNINTDSTADICIVYLGIPTDDKGYPLVPDDIYFYKALESYVVYMMDYIEWRRGKITDKVFQHSEREWMFYVNSARGSANQPNTVKLEILRNVWQRLIPQPGEYYRHFNNLGKYQGRKLH